jgi:protein-tyrosine phosphatase
VWGYFRLLFDFVENELKSGRNVLIHCLAGAHRAGTAGVACLMHFCRLESKEAVRAQNKL